MALKNQVSNVYSVGLQNVGSYQVSGQPYLSGSTTRTTVGSYVDGYFHFPYVTKKVTITNNETHNNAIVSFAPLDNAATYGFTNNASGSGNWLFLSASQTIEMNVKCKELFVSPYTNNTCSVTVYGELTNIPTGRMFSLDGVEGATVAPPGPAPTSPARNQVANVYSVGRANVGSYQVSGRPFITGSNIETNENKIKQNRQIFVVFPKITKSLTVWNWSTQSANKLRITFASTGSMTNYPANGCYYELAPSEKVTLDVKCKKVYLSAVGGDVLWKLYSSLTNIPASLMYDLTGSGISE